MELRPHRRSGHLHCQASQPPRRGGKSDEGGADKGREPAIRPAGNGIRLVEERRCVGFASCENGRGAGETAHGQHGLRGTRFEHLFRREIRLPEAAHERADLSVDQSHG